MPEFRTSSRKLLAVFAAAVVLFSAVMLFVSYRQQVELYEKQELARLEGIASTLALRVESEDIEYLLHRYPEKDALTRSDQDSVYLNIHRKLRATQAINELSTPVYLLRYAPDLDKFCFTVTSADSPYWLHVYDDFPSQLATAYNEGGRIEMYQDRNGTWLSAFGPVKNKSGQTISVLQVDEKFDRFIEDAQSSALRNSVTSLFIALFMLVIMFFVIQQLTQQQQRIHDEKAALVALRTELLSNISHDLRTPLSNVQGYIETALLRLDSGSDGEVRRFLHIGLRNTEKLSRMIDELFELSKIESRKRTPEITTFAIAELLFDTLSSFTIKALKAGVELHSDIPEDLPAVKADIAMIDRVLQNTLGNAVLYTPPGGSVTISAVHQGDHVLVEITDTGSGIPSEELPKVFERFHRSANATEGGTGLGLAIVKGILDLHGAAFGMDSQEGQGTRFWFQLSKA